MPNSREFGIDVARLFSMLMVVFLHNLGQGGVLDWSLSSHHAIAYMLLENCCIVAVNVFGLISGWLAVGRPVRIGKLGTMWLQVAFWSIAIGLVGLAIFGRPYLRTFVGTITPVLSREYWYFNAYIGMQLLAYFIAPALVKLPRATVASVSLMLAILFCSLGFIEGDASHGLAAASGYSASWLLVLWLCGASLRLYRDELRDLFPTWRLALAVILIPCASLACELYDSTAGGGAARWISYVSPLVALQSLALFALLARMDIRSQRLQAALPPAAAAAFNVYLIDMHPLVFNVILKKRFVWINQLHGAIGLCAIIGISLAMFIIFLALGMVYESARKRVRKALAR